MRIVAGIMLIGLGVLGLTRVITLLSELVDTFSFVPVSAVPTMLFEIAPSAFFVIGGVFCLKRRYWRVCLASASFAIFIHLFFVVGSLLSPYVFAGRMAWAMIAPMACAIVFIARTKKEWREISDSVDGEVSDAG